MSHYDHEPPPRVKPKVIGAPRIRQLYWCRLPTDAELPEFWKRRPVIIISYDNTLHGAVTVVPTTSIAQPENKWACKLNISLDSRRESWAICDKPMTVAVSRLEPARHIPRLSLSDFEMVVALLMKWLPKGPTP
ncbi:MAG TPA: type II toxin-antitoxin system PemK/MazF family toxin [Methylocystis sp.]|jgi:mRNA interferase MazF